MNVNQVILIFSVFQSSKEKSLNEENHNRTMTYLTKTLGLSPIELIGSYEGKEEKSILLMGFHQECYLESDNDRLTSLIYSNGERVNIGYLTPVDKETAHYTGNWSYNPNTDQYYITIKEPKQRSV